MRLVFHGAAQEVTGSMHELQVAGSSYLLDCGMLQGPRQLTYQRNSKFPFSPAAIKAVVLSHAHIDHSGNLPTLAKQGFAGPIHTSPASTELCQYMLADSAHLQESDAGYMDRRRSRRQTIGIGDSPAPLPPLYTSDDVARTMSLFVPLKYHAPREIGTGINISLTSAGHMLGSACVLLGLTDGGRSARLLFSGDLGKGNLPIIGSPEPAPAADYLILESTYGDRNHQGISSAKQQLATSLQRTIARGGRVIVPAFAVGRTQQIVYLLHQLMLEHSLPDVPIYVDSPLGLNVTQVYRDHPEEYDAETSKFLAQNGDPFGFARLQYIQDVAGSKALNDLRTPFVVIASSGMCEGGRVLHHLKNGIGDPRNLILLTGYQAEQTLGRKIADHQPVVNIFGEPYELKAEVEMLDELSGHADQAALIEWVRPIARSLKKVFLVHGERTAQPALATVLKQQLSLQVEVPAPGAGFDL